MLRTRLLTTPLRFAFVLQGGGRASRARQGIGLAFLGTLLALVAAAGQTHASEACGQQFVKGTPAYREYNAARIEAASKQAPSIIDEGFRAATRTESNTRLEATHLWLQFDAPPLKAHGVILEPVWGAGPASLHEMWGEILPLRNNHVFIYPRYVGPHRDSAFTLGVRARYVYRDGSVSAPSLPVFISHTGDDAKSEGVSADQVVFALACLMLLGLWWAFRREPDSGHRIRLAAAAGLVSLLFLAVSPALSWVEVQDPSGRLPTVQCHLGDEVQCATFVPDSGPNPLSLSDVAAERRLEVARWVGASAALRVGLILCMVLLMPALIWLLVAPGLRTAQTALGLGASAAGYTCLAVLFYRLTTPSWMTVTSTPAFDLGILATLNILASAVMVIYWSFRHSALQVEVPKAVAREISAP